MQESVGGIASFRLRLPEKNSYILYIYAKEDTPENKDNVYAQVCEYKIVQEECCSPPPEPFPPCAYLNWGPGTSFFKYRLATYQQTAQVITREGKAELQIKIPKSMQFMAKLKSEHHSDSELGGLCHDEDCSQEMRVTANLIEVEKEKDYPEFVFTQTQGSVVSFMVSMPNVGFYKLQLYAIPSNDTSQQLPGVYNYLVNCKSSQGTCVPYPKQYAQWKEGCYMWSPLCIHKSLGQPKVNFKVSIPKAEAVAVVTDSEWTHLQSVQPGIWTGEVEVGKYFDRGCKVTLNANYGGDRTNYATLLEYNI
ncbi:hypothetical protein FSP39_006071 [Pinctada imbricata]|uniref:KY-like immunoglobulin-like domain-containing protein n=1 Tax=Pinctada imbricata TaxID=66713 RepID=A0AA88XZD9_PINIB|nr:hypothetical protein FSP39_006071 [Pinctada imbricata]